MADAEEEAVERIPRLVEIEQKMRQLVLRHKEWQAQLQAQAQVDLAQEAERLNFLRMFEELGYVRSEKGE
jgi:hypothetical protein